MQLQVTSKLFLLTSHYMCMQGCGRDAADADCVEHMPWWATVPCQQVWLWLMLARQEQRVIPAASPRSQLLADMLSKNSSVFTCLNVQLLEQTQVVLLTPLII